MTDQTSAPAGGRRERRATPESLRLRSFTPSFTVDDLERSRRFYVEGLGFTVHEEWEEGGEILGLMLVAGDCHVGLSQDDGSRGRDRTKGVGFRLWAETVQDLDALAERLREHGADSDGPKTEPWGARTLTVTDPDGYKLSFTPPQAS